MFFNTAFTGTRYAANTSDKGKITIGTGTSFSFKSSVQPAPADALKTLPEGLREIEAYELYTDTELFSVRESGKKNADRVSIRGKTFQVVAVSPWQNNVIPHYKAIVSLVDG